MIYLGIDGSVVSGARKPPFKPVHVGTPELAPQQLRREFFSSFI